MKISSSIFLCTLLSVMQTVSFHSQGQVPRPRNYLLRNESPGIWRQPTKGDDSPINAVVLLGEFNDVSFTFSADQFRQVLSGDDASSAGHYLKEQLGREVKIDVFGPFQAKKKRSHYGTNGLNGTDLHPGEFISEICIAADGEVDYSKYDFDSDGVVDNVFVIYAGGDESFYPDLHPDYIWAHAWSLSASDFGKQLILDGITINRYACHSEIDAFADREETISQIGGFCHEFLHLLGLVDLYDTDYEKSGGNAAGCWNKTDIMDSGAYNDYCRTPPNLNAVNREILGTLVPEELAPGKYHLYPIGDSRAASYRISNPADPKEYYLIECRNDSGWDKYIGGRGMLLYHIDKSEAHSTFSEKQSENISSQARWSVQNEVNCRPDHQCADLVEADGRVDKDPTDISLNNLSGIYFPQPGSYGIGGEANVKLKFWDGKYADVIIKDISLSADGTVSFEVFSASSPLPPTPLSPPEDTDNVFIIVQTDNDGTGELSVSNSVGATVQWFFNGESISDPSRFTPSSDGEIKAVITWSDGTVDKLFKSIRK